MMIDKRVDTIDAALSGIEDGSTILVSGFGNAGSPIRLLEALIDRVLLVSPLFQIMPGKGNSV